MYLLLINIHFIIMDNYIEELIYSINGQVNKILAVTA